MGDPSLRTKPMSASRYWSRMPRSFGDISRSCRFLKVPSAKKGYCRLFRISSLSRPKREDRKKNERCSRGAPAPLSECQLWFAIVALDHGSQADRLALPGLGYFFLLYRGSVRDAHST